MGAGLRESMAWLHTWGGVVLGALLFAIFWMGTLSVFDREIDRWMMPGTRLALPAEPLSLDAIAAHAAEHVPSGARRWSVVLPTPRDPVARFRYRPADGPRAEHRLDPSSGRIIAEQGTWAGTRFIYPFHYRLHIGWLNLGYWLVGLCAMAMLALLVSGIIIHRRIFTDFFTFRATARLPRSSLDLHNLSSVLGLPFHLAMTLSGLIIFIAIYFPTVGIATYGDDRAALAQDAYGRYQRAPAQAPGTLGSLDAMAAEATRRWNGDAPYFVRVWQPGDANAYVSMRRNYRHSVTMNVDTVVFDAVSGEVLLDHTTDPVMGVQRFISGLHFIQFEHWLLRWLYFVLGLAGCVMIATGFIYWLETRRKRHAREGRAGVGVVDGLTVGSVTGIVVATLAFFVANRLLPLGASFAGFERHALEMWAFYMVWLGTFAHAFARPRDAWRPQCVAIALLGVLAVLLNAVTTGQHLLVTLREPHLYGVAGMDLTLLAGSALAATLARALGRGSSAGEPSNAEVEVTK